jgi:hypothetical protein
MESASDRLRQNLNSRRVRAGPIGNLNPDVLRLIWDEVEGAGRAGRHKVRLILKRVFNVEYWLRKLSSASLKRERATGDPDFIQGMVVHFRVEQLKHQGRRWLSNRGT